jgi:predicted nucleic acid binding AN1-type Zn finger protein
MDFNDTITQILKKYNTAAKEVAKNEGVILKVVDSISNTNIINPISSTDTTSVKKIPMRCCIESCKKKLSLSTNFTCKCDKDKIYCSAHRMPEDHACNAPIEKIKLDKVAGDAMRGGRI